MKKGLRVLLGSFSVACSCIMGMPGAAALAQEESAAGDMVKDSSIGICYVLTEEMKEAGMELQVSGISTMVESGELAVFFEDELFGAVEVMPESVYLDYEDGMTAMEALQKYRPDCILTETEKDGYYFLKADITPEMDWSSLDAEETEKMKGRVELFHAFMDGLEYIDVEPEVLGADALVFETKNLDGDTVTNEVFAEKDITVVNVWATYCNPCINEMPELAQWEAELPENVQILYFCNDIESMESSNMALADTIAEKSGISRENVLLNLDGAFSELNRQITAVPTTFFVDGEGNILGEPVVGAYLDKYKSVLEDLL